METTASDGGASAKTSAYSEMSSGASKQSGSSARSCRACRNLGRDQKIGRAMNGCESKTGTQSVQDKHPSNILIYRCTYGYTHGKSTSRVFKFSESMPARPVRLTFNLGANNLDLAKRGDTWERINYLCSSPSCVSLNAKSCVYSIARRLAEKSVAVENCARLYLSAGTEQGEVCGGAGEIQMKGICSSQNFAGFTLQSSLDLSPAPNLNPPPAEYRNPPPNSAAYLCIGKLLRPAGH